MNQYDILKIFVVFSELKHSKFCGGLVSGALLERDIISSLSFFIWFTTCFISSESVLTKILSTAELFNAVSITQKDKGLPAIFFMFLCGMDLLPPLKGIKATIECFLGFFSISIFYAGVFLFQANQGFCVLALC